MSKKQGFFILAGVGIGLLSGLSPLGAHANALTADAKQDLQAVQKKMESAETKLDKALKGGKASIASPATAFRTVPCSVDALTVQVKEKEGEFSGMSHDGVELILANTGGKTCAVPGRPDVSFLSHAKKSLPIKLQTLKGFHPGPVIAPVVLVPGAKAVTNLRWVACKVFDKNICYKPHFVTVKIQGQEVRVPFKTRICGDKAKGAVYETGYFHVVPVKKSAQHLGKRCNACAS